MSKFGKPEDDESLEAKAVWKAAQEILNKPELFKTPENGAVFWTNRAHISAVNYCRSNNESKKCTIEGVRLTEFDIKLDIQIVNQPPPDYQAYGTPGGVELQALDLYKLSSDQMKKIWDQASVHYVNQAKGKVEVFLPTNSGESKGEATKDYTKIRETSVFARIERELLIRNKNVTEINGVKRELLEKLLNKTEREIEEKNTNTNTKNKKIREYNKKIRNDNEPHLTKLNALIECGNQKDKRANRLKEEKRMLGWDKAAQQGFVAQMNGISVKNPVW